MSEHKLQQNAPATIKNVEAGYVEIIDQQGNKVRLKKEEAALLSDGLKVLDEQRIILG